MMWMLWISLPSREFSILGNMLAVEPYRGPRKPGPDNGLDYGR
jgi:hypothetical protein